MLWSCTIGKRRFPSIPAYSDFDFLLQIAVQVDYGATAEELEAHFHGCGSVNRVTILCNKFDGHPKGFAYIEFTDKESVQMAMAMDESLFRGRQIKVNDPSPLSLDCVTSMLLLSEQ